jgi:epoxide hydrolase 4
LIQRPGSMRTIRHQTLAVIGQRLYAASAAPLDGSLALLLHGFPEVSYGWRHRLYTLAAHGLHVVAPDQRGYGWSSKPLGIQAYALEHLADDIVALAHAFGHSTARLVGHDWGGLVSWALMAREPDFVERAVILNAPHPGTVLAEALSHPPRALKSSYVGLFQLPWLPEVLLSLNDCMLLKGALTSSSRARTFGSEDLKVYAKAWAMGGALTAMLNWYRATPPSPRWDTGAIEPSVPIIWGDRDTALNARLAERAAARCLTAEVFHLEDATHWLHHEPPQRISDVAKDFGRLLNASGVDAPAECPDALGTRDRRGSRHARQVARLAAVDRSFTSDCRGAALRDRVDSTQTCQPGCSKAAGRRAIAFLVSLLRSGRS